MCSDYRYVPYVSWYAYAWLNTSICSYVDYMYWIASYVVTFEVIIVSQYNKVYLGCYPESLLTKKDIPQVYWDIRTYVTGFYPDTQTALKLSQNAVEHNLNWTEACVAWA